MTTLSEALTTRTQAQALEWYCTQGAGIGIYARGMQSEKLARGLFEINALSTSEWEKARKEVVEGGHLDLALGLWLTLLAGGFFGLTRAPATNTVGKIRFTDATDTGPHNVAIGRHWARSQTTGARFINTEAATVPKNGYVDVTYKAEVAGIGGNVPNGSIVTLENGIAGVTISNPAIGSSGTWLTAAGRDEELDEPLRARCRARWGSLGAGGNIDAYNTWIVEAFTSAGLEPTVTRWRIDDTNPDGPGSVGAYLANAAGPATLDEIAIVDPYLRKRKALGGTGKLTTAAVTSYSKTIAATIYATGNSAAAEQAAAALLALAARFDIGGTLYANEIIATLMAVDGVYNLTLDDDSDDVIPATSVLVVTPDITLG